MVSLVPQETKREDGKSDREGKERRRTVGHAAKQTGCAILTDVGINTLAQLLHHHHLEETHEEKKLRKKVCQILIM